MRTDAAKSYLNTWNQCSGGNSQGFEKKLTNSVLGEARGGKMACVHGSGLVYSEAKRGQVKFNYQ